MADVIVVGAGHNGLVAACYLARAGRDVLVVEAAEVIGGCTTTAPIPGAPGYYSNPCAFDVIALRLSTIGRDLELARHGYAEVAVDPCYVALGAEGESLAFWRDPKRTAAEIRRFSTRDERAFLELMRELDHVADAMLPMMLTNPTRPDRGALAAALKAAGRHPKSFGRLIGLLTGSAAQALTERFEHPVVRGTLAMLANFGSPVSSDGSGVNLMVLPLICRAGMSRPVGGLGALVDALAADLREHGGRIRTGARVERLRLRGERIAGVDLVGGESLDAPIVLTACDPRTALSTLLPSGAMSRPHEARAAAIPVMNDGCTHYRLDLALDGRLELPRHAAWRGDGLDLRKPSQMIGDLEEICEAISHARTGRVPHPLPMVNIIASATDPGCAPAGGDVLSVWSGWTPHYPPEGWDALREPVADAVVERLGEYYSGIKEHTVCRTAEAWPDISARTNVPEGNVYHVDMSPFRTGGLRPARGFGGYRTPVSGLFITGAGTHPGPSVSGIPGRLAAKVILRQGRS
jgi:phytoene dehydrogenase-like protein